MSKRNKGEGNIKSVLAFIIILILAIAAYITLSNQVKAPIEQSNSSNVDTVPLESTTTTPTQQTTGTKNEATPAPVISEPIYSSGEESVPSPDIQVVAINYDGTKFSPSTVNIKVGDYVIFYNQSSKAFWPASGDHPTHTKYPEFDAKAPIDAGAKFQFQFTKAGNWGFHDHLNPSATGMVNVVE